MSAGRVRRTVAAVAMVPATYKPLDPRFYTTAQLQAILGNVSSMSLWRWQKESGMPAPIKLFGRATGRNFWRRADIEKWLATRTTAAE